jgi:hypothetical protein
MFARFASPALDTARESMYLSDRRRNERRDAVGGVTAHEAPRTVRRIMINNVGDGLLLDVRGIGLAESDPTGLDIALERILSSNSGCNFNSFSSSI